MKDIKVLSAKREILSDIESTGKNILKVQVICLKVWVLYKGEPLEVLYCLDEEKNTWEFFYITFSTHQEKSNIEKYYYDQARREKVGQENKIKIDKNIFLYQEDILNHERVRLKTII